MWVWKVVQEEMGSMYRIKYYMNLKLLRYGTWEL